MCHRQRHGAQSSRCTSTDLDREKPIEQTAHVVIYGVPCGGMQCQAVCLLPCGSTCVRSGEGFHPKYGVTTPYTVCLFPALLGLNLPKAHATSRKIYSLPDNVWSRHCNVFAERQTLVPADAGRLTVKQTKTRGKYRHWNSSWLDSGDLTLGVFDM